MNRPLAAHKLGSHEIHGFLAALRTAARTGDQLLLSPDQVRMLVSEEIYTAFARLEAQGSLTRRLSGRQ